MRALIFVSASGASDIDGLLLARVQIAGKVTAQFGNGVSNVNIDDGFIGGPLTVDTSTGSDTVRLDASEYSAPLVLAKPVVINLGDDGDSLLLGGNSAANV